MSVAVQQNIPLGKRRRAGRVVMVAVGGKHCAGTGIQQGDVLETFTEIEVKQTL